MEEKLYFKNSDALKLCGVLTKPAKKTLKCIVLCHGIAVDKEEEGIFTGLAKKLASAGFAVFRFDFRGHGESEGNSIDMTISGEKRDLEAAVSFLKSQGYKKFGILGASFSGGAVSYFVPEHQDIVQALVLWNPQIDYRSVMKPELPWQKENFGLKALLKMKMHGFAEIGETKFKVGPKVFAEIPKLEPWKELMRVKMPMLFIHGDKDTFVPYYDSLKYSTMLKAQLKTIHGAEHGFHDNKAQEEEADNATIEFFKKNM